MASRFAPSSLHQRDARSALFDGYERRSGVGQRPNNTSPAPGGTGGYGYSAGPGGYTSGGYNAGGYSGGGYNGGGMASGGGGINGGFRSATPNRKGQYSDAVIDELESQNDEQVGAMSARVKALKDITIAIGDEIRDSSALADKMNDGFERTRTRLRGTMTRMLRMAERTGVGWRVWLGFFAAVAVVFWWVWIS